MIKKSTDYKKKDKKQSMINNMTCVISDFVYNSKIPLKEVDNIYKLAKEKLKREIKALEDLTNG